MPYEGMSIIGYDNAKKIFQSSWVDNMGTGVMTMEGTYDPATKTLILTGKGYDPMAGKDMNMKQTFRFTDDKHQVKAYHLSSAAGSSAAFYSASSTVANEQEAHQPARCAATAQLLAFGPYFGIVGTYARAVFEYTRFPHPQVHNAAFVHQVIAHTEYKAGMRLRAFVSILRAFEITGMSIYIEMALGLALNAVTAVQAGIEPLRRIGRAALHHYAVYQLLVENLCILL